MRGIRDSVAVGVYVFLVFLVSEVRRSIRVLRDPERPAGARRSRMETRPRRCGGTSAPRISATQTPRSAVGSYLLASPVRRSLADR
jgi:hypothetical protein